MEKKDLSLEELLNKAKRYCALSEHCAEDVKQKILSWGGNASDFAKIINPLYEQNYLNDARYCQAFVRDKVRFQKWGRRKIEYMLQAKNLPNESIQEALKNIDESEYIHMFFSTLKNKENASEEERIRYLLQRGFLYSEIIEYTK